MNHTTKTTTLGILLGLAVTATASAQGIFQDSYNKSLTNSELAQSMVEDRQNALRSRYVQLDTTKVADAISSKNAIGESILELNLFPDVYFEARIDEIESRGDVFTVHGEVDAEHFGRARLTLSDAGFLGQIHVDDKMFEIVLLEDGTSAIVEVDTQHGIHDEEHLPVAPKSRFDERPLAGLNLKSTPFGPEIAEIDLLLVLPYWYYVPFCIDSNLAALFAADYESSLDTYMDWSGFVVPGFSIDWNVIVDCQTSVFPSGDLGTDLEAIDEDPAINALRDQHNADMVSMLVHNGGNSAGIAWYSRNGVSQKWAYSVVVHSYALANYTLHHELGHNLGMNHNRANADDNVASYCAYGKKLRKASNNSLFGRTIMSYGSQTRYPSFTNACIRGVNGISTTAGVACSVQNTGDDTGSAYNTQQLMTRAPVAANFR